MKKSMNKIVVNVAALVLGVALPTMADSGGLHGRLQGVFNGGLPILLLQDRSQPKGGIKEESREELLKIQEELERVIVVLAKAAVKNSDDKELAEALSLMQARLSKVQSALKNDPAGSATVKPASGYDEVYSKVKQLHVIITIAKAYGERGMFLRGYREYDFSLERYRHEERQVPYFLFKKGEIVIELGSHPDAYHPILEKLTFLKDNGKGGAVVDLGQGDALMRGSRIQEQIQQMEHEFIHIVNQAVADLPRIQMDWQRRQMASELGRVLYDGSSEYLLPVNYALDPEDQESNLRRGRSLISWHDAYALLKVLKQL